MDCLTETELLHFVRQLSSLRERSRVEQHVDGCDECRLVLGALAQFELPLESSEQRLAQALGAGASPTLASPAASEQVGRFLLLERLGSGSMGVVYAAYDPQLDRKIALKLLRSRRAEPERLLREARSMARLSHPNVVAVHDVVLLGDEVALAMEFVDGRTLRSWLAERKRSTREVLRVFASAGRGLEAAHRAGVVHRDFKAENVLVGNDGRVRVSDFGLATGGEDPSVGGTPAYMAPELVQGERASASSDQFSFCVSLYEALSGRRPFEPEMLRHSALPRPPALPGVGRRVNAALARGLSARPGERFADLSALLAALLPASSRRSTSIFLAAAAGLLLVALLVWNPLRQMELRQCKSGDTLRSETWSAELQQRAAAAFRATGRADAEAEWARVSSRVERYLSDWNAARTDACEDTHLRHQQSAALLDLRLHCLERLGTAVAALAEHFRNADAQVVERAATAVDALAPPSTCEGRVLMEGRAVVPPQAARALPRLLAEAKSLMDTGRYGPALTAAVKAVEAAREAGHPPLLAESLVLLGQVRALQGDFAQSEADLWEALEVGSADAVEAQAWSRLLVVVGHHRGRAAEARRLFKVARGSVRRIGDPPDAMARLLTSQGAVLMAEGKYAEAISDLERALMLREHEKGADSPLTHAVMSDLGLAYERAGRLGEAEGMLRKVLAERTRLFGPLHPDTAIARNNLGSLLFHQRRFPEARAQWEEALAIRERSLGPHAPALVTVLMNLASVKMLEGQPELAVADSARALSLARASYGPEHPLTGKALGVHGQVELQRGEVVNARALLEQALRIREQTVGPNHPDVALDRLSLGRLERAAGNRAAARAQIERGLLIIGEATSYPLARAELEFNLGMLLGREEHSRAIQLVRGALERYRESAPTDRGMISTMESWLRAH